MTIIGPPPDIPSLLYQRAALLIATELAAERLPSAYMWTIVRAAANDPYELDIMLYSGDRDALAAWARHLEAPIQTGAFQNTSQIEAWVHTYRQDVPVRVWTLLDTIPLMMPSAVIAPWPPPRRLDHWSSRNA